jgi:inorganic pyrophosphatase
LKDINQHLLKELEHFFVSYHALSGSSFRILGLRGPKRARKQIRRARQQAKRRKARTS